MDTKSPANSNAPDKAARKRIPMSIPQRKLEVPEISGYHLHWFLDSNVPRAIQGGYEMVRDDEVPLHQFGVGTDKTLSGNADLGTNVRVFGGRDDQGKAEHLNLMKIKIEWWDEDRKTIEARNASVMAAIFRDEQIAGSDKVATEDRAQSYVKTALFNRPKRK